MDFTPAQRAALQEISDNRFTVVRAGPGSGKTRVFVEAFKREIERSSSTRFGVAALSFTNVAHEEITRRMGGKAGAPHFVGTLDAFFWRFVVRPFGTLAGITSKGARLLPSPLDELQYGPETQYGPDHRQRTTVFEIRFTGGDEDAPELRMDKSILGSPFAGCVLSAKKAEWLKNGRVTHSDAQFLASSLLRGAHGKVVRGIVARRFPVILVDEFQDTGYFLGRALLSLLETPTVHGAVVGDPDQAIFQFGGAEKCLFEAAERVAGRSGIVLDESHRCPRKVAAVATALSRSGKPVTSLARASEGRAVIVVHDQKEEDLGAVLAGLGDVLAERTATVLARKTVTVRRLGRGLAPRECPSGCKFGRGMSRAAERLLAGDPTLAARITWKELGGLVLGDEDVDLDGLRERSIYSLAWRKACHAVLFEAVLAPAGESWNTWAKRLRERVRREAESLLHPVEKLGTRIRGFGGDGDGARYADWGTGSSSPLAEVMTVHQAKGREFPAVVFYTPKPHKKNAPCPSVEWWSAEPGSEEREIAFVACSRSEDLLVLAVHRDTFNSLDQLRPDFVRLFEAVNELPPAAQKTPMRRSKKASADDEVDPNHRE